MKISYNWLKSLFPVDLPTDKLGEILTDTGLEVEGIERFDAIEGGLDGIVIGEVLEKAKHPNADRLNICKVDTGAESPVQIVCGAANVDSGQKVVVATPGAMLYPVSGDAFKIKKGKIRGEESLGMICAEDEIGLGQSHDGIMVLDTDLPNGTPASQHFNLEPDFCIEIGLTPNRTDAMCHWGVARDLRCAMINTDGAFEGDVPTLTLQDSSKLNESKKGKISVEVQALDGAPRYAGIEISDLKIAPSPDWLQNRLKTIGLNPINNVVDATNYVLHELGQPLHAFDRDKIEGNQLIVRRANEGEKFTTLDEVERELDNADLMICDASKSMCIAGVFGGIDSGVSESTTSIFLESARFDPVSVRKSAKRHGLNTDASFRFERGVDPEITVLALERAAHIICEIAGGKIDSELIDLYPTEFKKAEVEVKWDRVNQIIGKDIPSEKTKNILKDLDIEILSEKDGIANLSIPLYRTDVTREADVVEEILRIYGYNNIELPTRLHSSISYAPNPNPEQLRNQVSDALVARGYSEMMSNSLTKEEYLELAGNIEENKSQVVKILNPLSGDLGIMRQTLLYQGLEAIQRNQNHKSPNLKLFEFGSEYRKGEESYKESPKLGIFLTGEDLPYNWNNPTDPSTFQKLASAVDTVIKKLGITTELTLDTGSQDIFSQSVELKMNGGIIGSMGWISSALKSKFNIDADVLYADLDWKKLIKITSKQKRLFKELERFPAVRRDLSLLIDNSTTFEEIKKVVQKAEKKILRKVGLFDVFEGKNLPEGKKSYCINIILQDPEKTLNDKYIDKTMAKILHELESQLGVSLR